MGTWSEERAAERIDQRISECARSDIEIKPYKRDTDLRSLGRTEAYRVDGVHVYADILNLEKMLNVTEVEGETCHKRTLRFLNLHFRAVARILSRVDAIFVDFHNQRLHAVVTKPYDDEADRLHRAIAMGQLIIDVLKMTGEDSDVPDADVRIGIDSGQALAVNNGRRGHREPLFLGEPANHAAKRAGGGETAGIYLTNTARNTLGLKPVSDEDTSALTVAEIQASQKRANLDVSVDDIVDEWEEDLEKNPISAFQFSGHTPPFSNLDMETLSALNSRRQDGISIYADIDGFTKYVTDSIVDDDSAKGVVQTLHVLRGELDAVLHRDFGGRKVRFIGDCVHGLMAEGTAQTADAELSISTAVLCAAGMRSSFELAIEMLAEDGLDISSLGLAIGVEYGPLTVTRLGIKGELIRCSISRGVLCSEQQQKDCLGTETGIGPVAYRKANDNTKAIFGVTHRRAGLTYDLAKDEMRKVRKAETPALAPSLLRPAVAAPAAMAATTGFAAKPIIPTSPAKFA